MENDRAFRWGIIALGVAQGVLTVIVIFFFAMAK
jgi:hypothetical protein